MGRSVDLRAIGLGASTGLRGRMNALLSSVPLDLLSSVPLDRVLVLVSAVPVDALYPSFPVDRVPDGNAWGAHHFVYAGWAALFVCWIVGDDERKPWVVVGGLMVGLFSWYHLWPSGFSTLGALGVLVGLAVATTGAAGRGVWRETTWQLQVGCLVCLLVAWDDALEHAFGFWMPLNWFWETYLYTAIT